MEDTRHFVYTDKMEFHAIGSPKLPEGRREGCSDIELWARFINAERKEAFSGHAFQHASATRCFKNRADAEAVQSCL